MKQPHSRRTTLAAFAALIALVAVFGVTIFGARRADAHPMPDSRVMLDINQRDVGLTMHIPLIELEVAYGKKLSDDPDGSLARYHDDLEAYLASHIHPVSPDGRPWIVKVTDVHRGENGTPPYWVRSTPYMDAHATLTPPPGAPVRRFTFNYDVVVHQLLTHVALVSVRHDWDNGVFSGSPVILGELRVFNKSFRVDLPPGSPMRGFLSVVHLGMRHIAEGTDHLLFLLALLLPAALSVKTEGGKRRWNGPVDVRTALWRLLKIVSAFTIGHSLTLIAGAVGWVRPPEQPIEVLIAVSIFVSAIHALRPLFPGREAWVAAGFGLIHGLSFAVVVADFGLDPWHTVLSIFGFNVGIEIMQLFVVAVTVPWLLLLARTPIYPYFRIGGATGAAIAAVAWTLERTFGWRNPIGDLVENIAKHAPYLVAALAALAIVGTVATRIKPGKTGKIEPNKSSEA